MLKAGDAEAALKLLSSPKEEELCDVEVKTSFEASTLNSKIDYLLKEYGKPVEIVTVELPCGQDWVDGLVEYCKSLAVDTDQEAAKSDKDKPKTKNAFKKPRFFIPYIKVW